MTTAPAPTELTFPSFPGQAGMATRGQLRARGWSPSAVRHRLEGPWQLVYPRVVAPHQRPINGHDRLIAAALWAGPRAVLTGGAGLWLQRLEAPDLLDAITFVVPQSQRAKRHQDAQVRRSDRPVGAYRVLEGVPVASPARCLVDAAAWEIPRTPDRTATTIAVLQQGLARPADVHHELRHARRNHTLGVSQGVRAFERGAWSRPEGVLGELFDSSEVLPHVCLNPRLVLPDGTVRVPDGYLREVALAIQVHSSTYHSREQDWQGTVEADAALIRAGIVVLGVTPQTLYEGGQGFLRDVEQTAVRLQGRPLPQITIRSRCC